MKYLIWALLIWFLVVAAIVAAIGYIDGHPSLMVYGGFSAALAVVYVACAAAFRFGEF